MYLILILIAIVSFAFWYFLIKPLNYWSNRKVIQTKPWPLFGDTISIFLRRKTFPEWLQSIYNLNPNGRYVGWYNMTKPALLLKDPELIKQITVRDFDHFVNHSQAVDPKSDPLWAGNLFALKDEKWKHYRQLVSPTFTSSKIKALFILIEETARNFVEHFQNNKNDLIIELEMKNVFTRFTNDVIASAVFGVKINSLKERENEFYVMGKQLTSFIGIIKTFRFLFVQGFPNISRYLGLTFIDKSAGKYFTKIVNNNIQQRLEKNIVRQDVINILLEARRNQDDDCDESNKISDADIASQAMIYFFAGFESISVALSFGSYELALNPEIQDKLRQEILKVRENLKADELLSYDDLQNMRYMDMFVHETLRKWPPFTSLDHVCNKAYIIEPINDNEHSVHINVNTELWIPIYSIHHDPNFYPNPEKFDPERFNEVNKNERNPYLFLSFGTGQRACIGIRFAMVEIKALFFYLLENFEIKPIKKTSIPMKLTLDIQPCPKEGMWLGLKPLK